MESSNMIKRYNIDVDYFPNPGGTLRKNIVEYEDSQGEWVKYEDVKHLINNCPRSAIGHYIERNLKGDLFCKHCGKIFYSAERNNI